MYGIARLVKYSLLNKKFLFYTAALLTTDALALSPQQYCEALEKKSPGAFELLNLETSGGEVSLRNRTITDELTNGSSTVPMISELTACGNSYKISIPKYSGNESQISVNRISNLKIEFIGNSQFDLCSSNGTGALCQGLSCIAATGPFEIMIPISKFGYSSSLETETGCANRKGYRFKNGNSCTVGDFKVTSALVPYSYTDPDTGEVKTGATTKYSVTVSENQTDSAAQIKAKYCAAGMFHFATVRSGPLSEKYDSVINCIRANGQSFPKPFSTKPLQGELLSDLKVWLVDKKGCGG